MPQQSALFTSLHLEGNVTLADFDGDLVRSRGRSIENLEGRSFDVNQDTDVHPNRREKLHLFLLLVRVGDP